MALRILLCLSLCVAVLQAASHHAGLGEAGVTYDGDYSNSVRIKDIEHLSRLPRQTEDNMNTTFDDHHDYYTSQFFPPGPLADAIWFDLSHEDNVEEIIEADISDKYRFLQLESLQFDFIYYGHIVDTIAVTTGGFLYAGPYLHQYVHLVQYIAPLQADFNANISDEAKILIYSSPERYTVQWDMIHNHDHVDNGTFTFQVSLFPSGEINFAYREIPLLVSEINNDDHPVVVGLADAFYTEQPYIDPVAGPVILVTIYEYHKVVLNYTDALAYGAYVITPLPTCIKASSCEECNDVTDASDFMCEWCSDLDRCSDGLDRHRQEWFTSGCVDDATFDCELTPSLSSSYAPPSTTITNTPKPMPTPTPTPTPTPSPNIGPPNSNASTGQGPKSEESSLSRPAIIGISGGALVLLVVIILVLVVCAFLIYGFRKPTSRVGLYMIQHRPKAWSLNKVNYGGSSASYNVENSTCITVPVEEK